MSSSSPPEKGTDNVETPQDTRIQTISELIKTEEAYVDKMKFVMERIFNVLKNDTNVISQENFRFLFGSYDVIFQVNSTILSDLKERMLQHKNSGNGPDDMVVGDIFLKLAPFLKAYIVYGRNYENALKSLAECGQSSPFKSFIKRTSGAKNTMGFMRECIVAPLERIFYYEDILNRLEKETSHTHPDHSNIIELEEKINTIGLYISEKKSMAENAIHIESIQKKLNGDYEDLVMPNRRFLLDGFLLQRVNRKESFSRYVVLFNDILVISAVPEKSNWSFSWNKRSAKYDFVERVELFRVLRVELGDTSMQSSKSTESIQNEELENNNNAVSSLGRGKHIFVLMGKKFCLSFQCISADQKDQWFSTLTQCIKEISEQRDYYKSLARMKAEPKASQARALIGQQYAYWRKDGKHPTNLVTGGDNVLNPKLVRRRSSTEPGLFKSKSLPTNDFKTTLSPISDKLHKANSSETPSINDGTRDRGATESSPEGVRFSLPYENPFEATEQTNARQKRLAAKTILKLSANDKSQLASKAQEDLERIKAKEEEEQTTLFAKAQSQAEQNKQSIENHFAIIDDVEKRKSRFKEEKNERSNSSKLTNSPSSEKIDEESDREKSNSWTTRKKLQLKTLSTRLIKRSNSKEEESSGPFLSTDELYRGSRSDERELKFNTHNQVFRSRRAQSGGTLSPVQTQLTFDCTPREIADLLNVLSDKRGYHFFEEFLKAEFAEENLYFWKEVEELQAVSNEEVVTKACEIYEKYIGSGVLNIQFSIRKELDRIFTVYKEEISKRSFDAAQEKTIDQMSFDNYKRFLKSHYFKKYQLAEKPTKKLLKSPSTDKRKVDN